MKFIIPQNYSYKNKILGIIDYPTAILNLIWDFLIYLILKKLPINISTSIFIFSTLCFPMWLLTIIGFNNESPIYSAFYIIKFLLSPKIYLYEKFKYKS